VCVCVFGQEAFATHALVFGFHWKQASNQPESMFLLSPKLHSRT